MEFLCTQATPVILLEWARDTVNDPRLGVDGFRVAGERIIRSVVGWETLHLVESVTFHLGCTFSDLGAHAFGSRKDIDSSADKLGGFFQVFPVSHLENSRVARGEGRYLEGIWGHLGRTNSCLAGHREKHTVPRGRERETGGPCEGEESVKSPLGGEELPFHSKVSSSPPPPPPEAVALLLASPDVTINKCPHHLQRT